MSRECGCYANMLATVIERMRVLATKPVDRCFFQLFFAKKNCLVAGMKKYFCFFFLPGPNGLPVYGLDTSHIEQWETSVRDPALRVIRSVYEDNNEIVSRLKSVPVSCVSILV